jgi:prepilin-type N-terminal cleavage/methylation domain-containing protein
MRNFVNTGRRIRQAGFTLIEVMIVVAIIGILAAIAVPAYKDYITRGQLVDATNALQVLRVSMEQYYQDNRTYVNVPGTPGFTSPCDPLKVPTLKYFSVTCSGVSATAYTARATGKSPGPTNGFYFQVDQGDNKFSQVSTAWDSSGTINPCWIMKKGSTC